MKRVAGLDWPLLALAGCLLALSVAGAATVDRFDDPKIGVFLLLQSVPYAIATWLVLRGAADGVASGRALATILLVGVAMRCLLLPGTPVSNDLFRYIWDGRVQAAGINPYLHVPSEEVLTPLRDAAIYPYINRADYAPTIYPPTSQIVFYLVTRISEAPIAMKAAMLAFEGLAVWTMLRLLALRGLPRSRILLYAWHPLPVWEFARSGHVDVVAIAFLLLAFLAAERRSPILAGVAFGAGALVKYFPVVTAPALYRRWDWRFPTRLHRHDRGALSPLYRRRREGIRLPRQLHQRGGLGPRVGNFPVAAPRRDRRAAAAGLCSLCAGRGDRSWRRSPSSSSCGRERRAAISPAPCCSLSLSRSWFRRITPGTSPGWCRSCVSIPPLA